MNQVYWTTVSRGYYFPLGAGLGVGIYVCFDSDKAIYWELTSHL